MPPLKFKVGFTLNHVKPLVLILMAMISLFIKVKILGEISGNIGRRTIIGLFIIDQQVIPPATAALVCGHVSHRHVQTQIHNIVFS